MRCYRFLLRKSTRARERITDVQATNLGSEIFLSCPRGMAGKLICDWITRARARKREREISSARLKVELYGRLSTVRSRMACSFSYRDEPGFFVATARDRSSVAIVSGHHHPSCETRDKRHTQEKSDANCSLITGE